MKPRRFKRMWETMQRQGYFANHVHYTDWFRDGESILEGDSTEPDALAAADHTSSEIHFDEPYSLELEKRIKRSERFWLPRLFSLPPGGCALDLGCGFGRSLLWLRQRFERVIGVDISEHAISLARERLGSSDTIELHVCSGDRLPQQIADRSVDFIYCFNVFEHIPRAYTRSYLDDFRRILRPGGSALFNLVSGRHEWRRSGTEETEWSIGYSQRAITRLVGASGLSLRRRVLWRPESSRAYWTWVQACQRD